MFGKQNVANTDLNIILNELIKSAEHLLKIVKEENLLLEVGRMSDFSATLQKKISIFEKFSIQKDDFAYHSQENTINKSDSKVMNLRRLLLELDKENLKNKHLIEVNREATQAIIDIYKETQAIKSAMQSGYNREGKFNSDQNNKKSVICTGLSNMA